MGRSEVTFTDLDISSPRPWVAIVSSPRGSISVWTVRLPSSATIRSPAPDLPPEPDSIDRAHNFRLWKQPTSTRQYGSGRTLTTKEVTASVISKKHAATWHGFVREHADPEVIVYIDEASTYQGAVRWHETVRHSVKDFVRD